MVYCRDYMTAVSDVYRTFELILSYFLRRWNNRIGMDKHPASCAVMWTTQLDETLTALPTGEPYKIHMAMFQSSNPCGNAITNSPDLWCEELKKLDFNFAIELFQNATTMSCCDVVLPLESTIEHNAMVVTHYGINVSFYGAEEKCMQVGECKSDVEILHALGQCMHPEFWDQRKTEDEYNECNGQMKWKDLREHVTLMTEEPYYKYQTGQLHPDGQPGFPTTTGRVELHSFAYKTFGDDPLPYYKEPPSSPVFTPDKMDEFPFVLTTSVRRFTTFHAEQYHLLTMRETDTYPFKRRIGSCI